MWASMDLSIAWDCKNAELWTELMTQDCPARQFHPKASTQRVCWEFNNWQNVFVLLAVLEINVHPKEVCMPFLPVPKEGLENKTTCDLKSQETMVGKHLHLGQRELMP